MCENIFYHLQFHYVVTNAVSWHFLQPQQSGKKQELGEPQKTNKITFKKQKNKAKKGTKKKKEKNPQKQQKAKKHYLNEKEHAKPTAIVALGLSMYVLS